MIKTGPFFTRHYEGLKTLRHLCLCMYSHLVQQIPVNAKYLNIFWNCMGEAETKIVSLFSSVNISRFSFECQFMFRHIH